MSGLPIKALTPETFADFAALVERNKGMFSSCWCTKFHPDCGLRQSSDYLSRCGRALPR